MFYNKNCIRMDYWLALIHVHGVANGVLLPIPKLYVKCVFHTMHYRHQPLSYLISH
jgi:hypothetical protein